MRGKLSFLRRGRGKELLDYKLKRETEKPDYRLKIEELKAQIEIKKIRAQAGVKTVGGAADRATGIYADQVKRRLPKLNGLVDGKDDSDSWLLRFERFASTSGWPKENWCTSLSALLVELWKSSVVYQNPRPLTMTESRKYCRRDTT